MGIKMERHSLPQITKFGTGLGLIRRRDPRDDNYLLSAHFPGIAGAEPTAPSPPLPPRKYYQLKALFDQGAHPHCVGYAWKHYLVCSPVITSMGPSADDIYYASQRIDGFPDSQPGTTVRAGAEVLRSLGYIEKYVWARNVDEVVNWLLSGKGPVVAGTDWWTGMADQRGQYAELTGTIEGGHAWMLIGWDAERDVGRIANSHGPLWGKNGRKWIRRNDLAALMASHGEVCCATEKRTGTEARKRRQDYLREHPNFPMLNF